MKDSSKFLRSTASVWRTLVICSLVILLAVPTTWASAENLQSGGFSPDSMAENPPESNTQETDAAPGGEASRGEAEDNASSQEEGTEETENATETGGGSSEPGGSASSDASSDDSEATIVTGDLIIVTGTRYYDDLLLTQVTAFDSKENDVSELLVVTDYDGFDYEPGDEIDLAGTYNISIAVIDEENEVLAEATRSIFVQMDITPFATGPHILGGNENNGDVLEITITPYGGVTPRRWYPAVPPATGYEWQRTCFNQIDGSGLSLWNGTTRLMQGGYFSAPVQPPQNAVPINCTISLGTKVTGSDGSETITRTWTGTGVANGIVIFETFRLDKGARFYTRTTEIQNNSNVALNNVRLYIGGDTFFRGSDSTYGNINRANNSVFVYRGITDGIMTLRGSDISPPNYYYSADYLTGRNLVLDGNNLTGATWSHIQNSGTIDTGYYLQWGDRNGGASAISIPSRGSYSVQTIESFSDPGALQVISPGGRAAPPGALVSYNFTLTNVLIDSPTGLNLNLSASSQHEIQGWVASVNPPSLALPGGNSVNVTVSVLIPEGAAHGMTDQLTLTVDYTGTYQGSPVSGTATGMTVTTVDHTVPYISDVAITYLDRNRLDSKIVFQNFAGATPTTVQIFDEFGVYTGITQTATISSGGEIANFNISSLVPGRKYYLYATAVGIPFPHNTTFFVVGDTYIPLLSLALTPPTATLYTNGTQQLTPVYTPNNTTQTGLTWTSSNPAVATVDANGLVRAVSPGQAFITARSAVNPAISASSTIFVQSPVFTVSFDANGGEAANPATKDVTLNQAYGVLATTERYGYRFDGWYTEREGGVLVTAASIVTRAQNHTLYAHWTALTPTVSFDANGGVAANPASKPVTFDSAYGALAVTERYGYTFDGWYTEREGGVLVTAATIVTRAENHTLYAHWTALRPTVSFDANGGGAANPATKTVTFDSAYGALATTERYGYTFDGWYTEREGGVLVTAATIVTRAENHTLYAHWTALTPTVTFNANSGVTAIPATKSVTFDSAYGALAITERYGYRFDGWYTEAEGGVLVTATTIVTRAEDHTLYAHWTALTFTVTFDANEGEAANPASKPVTFDSAYGALAVTERYGYVFAGWFTEPQGGSRVTATTIVTRAEDHTLYAQWAAEGPTITFDANGGVEADPIDKHVVFDEAYGVLATTERYGYSFTGWYTEPEGGVLITALTIVSRAEDHTLYAQWTALTPTVSFNANGGEAANPASKTVTFDSAYGALATTERYGYTFTGWYTAAQGGELVTATTIVTRAENHTLFAHWVALSPTVTFDANGGEAANPASKTVFFDSPYGILAVTERYGYTFAGWYTEREGGVLVTAMTIVTRAENHTLYAHWTALRPTVSFDANGGAAANPASKGVTFDEPYGTLAVTDRYGYTFRGWYTEPEGGVLVTATTIVTRAENHTLYAHWTALSPTVSFDTNGGEEANPASKIIIFDSAYGTLATTERYGYTFNGWHTEPQGGMLITSASMVTRAEDHTLYAHWTALSPTVSFNANGGEAPDPASKTVTIDESYGVLASTERYGYAFTGWYTEPQGGVLITAASMVTRAEDHTLYAQWTALNPTVSFNANGGGAANPASKTVTFDSAYGALATTERYGYTFTGWYTAAQGGDLVTSTSMVTRAENHTLFAHWVALSPTVTFNANGGEAANPASKTVFFDSAYGNLATTERYGYVFAGWFTAAQGGVPITPMSIVARAENHTLYAQWTPRSDFTVTYLGNENTGGSAPVDTNSPYVFNTSATALGQESLSRAGYTFQGWSLTINGGVDLTVGQTFTITSHVTLFAVWAANPPQPPAAAPPTIIIIQQPVPQAPAPEPPDPPAEEPEEVVIPEREVPLAVTPAPPVGAWALLNIAVTILGFMLVLIMLLIIYFNRKDEKLAQNQDSRDSSQKREKKESAGHVEIFINTLLGTAAVVIFLLSQDIQGSMVLFDSWTIAHLAVLALQAIVLSVLAVKLNKKQQQEKPAESNQQELQSV